MHNTSRISIQKTARDRHISTFSHFLAVMNGVVGEKTIALVKFFVIPIQL